MRFIATIIAAVSTATVLGAQTPAPPTPPPDSNLAFQFNDGVYVADPLRPSPLAVDLGRCSSLMFTEEAGRCVLRIHFASVHGLHCKVTERPSRETREIVCTSPVLPRPKQK